MPNRTANSLVVVALDADGAIFNKMLHNLGRSAGGYLSNGEINREIFLRSVWHCNSVFITQLVSACRKYPDTIFLIMVGSARQTKDMDAKNARRNSTLTFIETLQWLYLTIMQKFRPDNLMFDLTLFGECRSKNKVPLVCKHLQYIDERYAGWPLRACLLLDDLPKVVQEINTTFSAPGTNVQSYLYNGTRECGFGIESPLYSLPVVIIKRPKPFSASANTPRGLDSRPASKVSNSFVSKAPNSFASKVSDSFVSKAPDSFTSKVSDSFVSKASDSFALRPQMSAEYPTLFSQWGDRLLDDATKWWESVRFF